jgi:hypothetical protein
MHLDLTPGSLFASLLVSSAGFTCFMYGKKQERLPQVIAGLALMVFPVFVTSPVWMLTVGAAVLGGLWASTRAGF